MSALSPTINPAPCRARSAHTKLNVSLLGEVANAEMLQARIRRISYGPALSPLRPIHRRCTRGLAADTRRDRNHAPIAHPVPHLSGRCHHSAPRNPPLPALRGRRRPGLPPVPPTPAETATTPPSRTQSRTYRADAIILLLGTPLFPRSAVGGGQASLEETGDGDRGAPEEGDSEEQN